MLNGELYAQRFQKLTYLYLFTDCLLKISLQLSEPRPFVFVCYEIPWMLDLIKLYLNRVSCKTRMRRMAGDWLKRLFNPLLNFRNAYTFIHFCTCLHLYGVLTSRVPSYTDNNGSEINWKIKMSYLFHFALLLTERYSRSVLLLEWSPWFFFPPLRLTLPTAKSSNSIIFKFLVLIQQ